MAARQLPRTLLIGLGPVSALVVDQLLGNLAHTVGKVEIVQAIVALEQSQPLAQVDCVVPVTPDAAPSDWLPGFEESLAERLRLSSNLAHLSQLPATGLALARRDEIWVLIVGDVAEPWMAAYFSSVAARLEPLVHQVLGCHLQRVGVVLDSSFPPQNGDSDAGVIFSRPDWLNAGLFEGGLFRAGLTNEMGLVLEDAAALAARTTAFLELYWGEPGLASQDWFDANPLGQPGTTYSFGVARLAWPGNELAVLLSERWSATCLNRLITLPSATGVRPDLAEQGRREVQQWLARQEVAPPTIVDQLIAQMPGVPEALLLQTPDPSLALAAGRNAGPGGTA
jgi:hypothetical protein